MWQFLGNAVKPRAERSESWERFIDWLDATLPTLIWAGVAVVLVSLVAGVLIARKAGYAPWWGALAALVPGLGVVLLLLFALFPWPIRRELHEAKGLLQEQGITTPTDERRALKAAERERKLAAKAQRELAQAQSARAQAEKQKVKFAEQAGLATTAAAAIAAKSEESASEAAYTAAEADSVKNTEEEN